MKRLAWLVPALAASVVACDAKDTGGNCAPGAEGCECYPNRSCHTGLICSDSDLCVDDEKGDDSGGSGNESNGGSAGSGGSGGSGDSGGDGGSSAAGGSSSDGGSSSSGTNDAGGASSTSDGGSSSSTDGAAGGSGGSGTAGSGGTIGTENTGTENTNTETTSTTTTGGNGGTTGETRTDLVPVDGWVDGSTNDVGIQGAWYTFSDGVSTVVPASEPFFEGAGSALCISGSAPPHENQDLSWGVAVGIDLNLQDGVATAYDAPAYGVVGLQFTVTGSLPPRLQSGFTTTNVAETSNYCRRYESITGSQETLSVYFDQMELDCWEVDVTNPAPDPTLLKAFQIAVISSANESVYFDFCVENVSAILE